jgi:hypothetical protein
MGREGKGSVPSLKAFRYLYGYTNTCPFRQYPGYSKHGRIYFTYTYTGADAVLDVGKG